MTELVPDHLDAGGGSRRTFLTGAAGAAAGAGVLVAAQTLSGAAPLAVSTPLAAAAATDVAAATSGALVAYVRDLAAGEIAVMRGDTEVVVVDHDLARALARLAG